MQQRARVVPNKSRIDTLDAPQCVRHFPPGHAIHVQGVQVVQVFFAIAAAKYKHLVIRLQVSWARGCTGGEAGSHA